MYDNDGSEVVVNVLDKSMEGTVEIRQRAGLKRERRKRGME